MKTLLVVAASLLLCVPMAQASTNIEGRVTASAVQTSGSAAATGDGLFLGFFQGGEDRPTWHATAEQLVVNITTYQFTSYGWAYAEQSDPTYFARAYGPSIVTQIEATSENDRSNLFWMMVSPLPDSGGGFTVSGTWPSSELQPTPSVFYDSRRTSPVYDVIKTWGGGGDGVNARQYRAEQPALEWSSAGTNGPLVIRGDFVVTVFQDAFAVTNGSGESDSYVVGDSDPGPTGLNPTSPIYTYEETLADISVWSGELTVLPNGRALQLDLATSEAMIHGAVDLLDAQGQLQAGSTSQPLAGRLRLDADALTLALMPHGTGFDAAFTGTVRSVQVDGRPVSLPPTPAVVTAVPSAEMPIWGLAAAVAATLLAMATAMLAVRSNASITFLMAQAQALFEVGSHSRALRTCRRIMRREPGHVDAITLAALCLIHMGRPAEAAPLLERGQALGHEDDGLLAMAESLILYHTGQAPAALARIEKAFTDHPALDNELAATDLRDQLRAMMTTVTAR